RRRFRSDVTPVLGTVDTIGGLRRCGGRGYPGQFTPCLFPVGVSRLVRIPLINDGNLSRAFLYRLGRGDAEPVTVNGYFSISRTSVFGHHIEYENRMQIVRMSKREMSRREFKIGRASCRERV